ncbi:hypothetical protein C8B47_10780 [filamentous cyanobacterium CCP4]|nr:hypothetical protein C8B47_10780 [filamentous cyanobacterium CCP4]
MASKRANAIKAQKAREAMADRMEAIEESQKLIMEKLDMLLGDEVAVEDAKASSKEADNPEGKEASKKASTKK